MNPSTRTVFAANRFNRLWGGRFVGAFIRRDSTVEGVAHLAEAWQRHRRGAPLVLICNHASYADSHIIEQLFARVGFREFATKLYHLAGQKTYRTPWRRFFTLGINTIKVIQGAANEPQEAKRRQAIESYRAFKRIIATNPVLLFPEGTRTRTGRMGPVVPTLAHYLRGNLVLPMALQGTERLLGVGMPFPRSSTVVLRIGTPFIADPVPHVDKRQEMAAYAQHIIDLLDPPYRPCDVDGSLVRPTRVNDSLRRPREDAAQEGAAHDQA